MKEKYAGFKYKTNSKVYMKFEQQVRKKSALKKIDCSILIYSYLNYFGDKHISFDDVISMPEYNNLKSDSKQHAASSYNPLEGIWATSNNLYIIDIRRKGNSYSGYLINSKLAEYSPGDLKIQLFGDDGENPYGIIYEKGELNVSRIFQFVKIKGQLLQIGPLL